MTERTAIAHLEVNGRKLEVGAYVSDNGQLTVTLHGDSGGCGATEISLPPPYRSAFDSPRLAVIVQSLLSHDFLLSKRLQRGGKLEFIILPPGSGAAKRLVSVVSLNQEAAVSTQPGEKILPWLLPLADTSALYPFQREGVEWLLASESRLLADDMGLGKTIQTIFGVRHGFSELLFRSVLVLCPKSLVLNWLAEFRKWAPELVSIALSPPAKTAEQVWRKALDNSHVVIANYEQIRDVRYLAEDFTLDLVVAE